MKGKHFNPQRCLTMVVTLMVLVLIAALTLVAWSSSATNRALLSV